MRGPGRATLAQPVERLICNQAVVGSTPTGGFSCAQAGTRFKRSLASGADMRRAWLPLLAGALLLPLSGAQAPLGGVDFIVGGEPGIVLTLDGADVRTSQTPGTALKVHPDTPVELSLSIAPPPDVTWELGAMRADLLLNGARSEGIGTAHDLDATIPPGFTVFINRTIDLAPLRPVGTGLFVMRVQMDDENGSILYSQDFLVHIQGHVILSVAGATATVATVATGYGLWSILNDLREFKKARERHRAREKERKRLAKLAEAAIALEDGLEGVVDVAGDSSSRAERLSRKRPLAWAATGLGVGSVTVSWAQFFGYVPVHVGTTLIVGMGTAAIFLTTAILVVVLAKRSKARRAVRIPVQGPPAPVSTSPEAATSTPVDAPLAEEAPRQP